jgi:hypothetical protein
MKVLSQRWNMQPPFAVHSVWQRKGCVWLLTSSRAVPFPALRRYSGPASDNAGLHLWLP